MADDRVQTGDVEPIQVFVVNGAGDPLTGLTDLFVRVRRDSDGFYFDWADSTFKAAGHTTLNQSLSEVDATNAAGIYEVTGGFDTSAIVNPTADDDYLVIPLQTPGSNAFLPSPGKFRVGDFVDNLDSAISAVPDDVWTHDISGFTSFMTEAGAKLNLLRKGLTNRLELTSGDPGTLRLFNDNDLAVLLTWTETDEGGGEISTTVGSPAKRAKAT